MGLLVGREVRGLGRARAGNAAASARPFGRTLVDVCVGSPLPAQLAQNNL